MAAFIRSQRFNGYKRHVVKDLDLGIVRAVGITPANVPEANITQSLAADLERQKVILEELYIDRAYLTSHWVKERSSELKIICKAWPVRHGKRFDKTAFILDWDNHLIGCPNGITVPFDEGKVVHFPQKECEVCPLRSQCTTSRDGRSISIHPDESMKAGVTLSSNDSSRSKKAQRESSGGTHSSSYRAMAGGLRSSQWGPARISSICDGWQLSIIFMF